MTKLHSILTLAIISIFAISCDNINLSNSEFVGELFRTETAGGSVWYLPYSIENDYYYCDSDY